MKFVELKKHLKERSAVLNENNGAYYRKMSSYILSSNVSPYYAQSVLSELLDHLLLAQERGKTAQQVFGDDPIPYCDEVLKTLPSIGFKELSRFFFVVFSFLSSLLLLIGGAVGTILFFTGSDGHGLIFYGWEFVFVVFYLLYFIFLQKLMNHLSMFLQANTAKWIILSSLIIPFSSIFFFLNIKTPLISISQWISLPLGIVGLILCIWRYMKWMKSKPAS